jgi:hypothetical protein
LLRSTDAGKGIVAKRVLCAEARDLIAYANRLDALLSDAARDRSRHDQVMAADLVRELERLHDVLGVGVPRQLSDLTKLQVFTGTYLLTDVADLQAVVGLLQAEVGGLVGALAALSWWIIHCIIGGASTVRESETYTARDEPLKPLTHRNPLTLVI